ncbi:MAG: hypothetical protein A2157_03580 [Deltaproteobacteria bacterium RBG_16_47_11]|nr:MAG: hypothetical protein A2157_03580 [Deltaproteobacteria bacterium RBG_16_47_11]
MFYYIGLVIGAILILLGLLGSFLPVLPGPPLSFIGLFLVALVRNFSPPLTPTLIIVMLIVTIAVATVDYFIPLLGAKKYGASRWAIYGSMGGMIIGLFFSPFGMLLGAFVGAVLVEWIVTRKEKHALKAGWGIFVGSIFGMALKLGVSAVMAYYFLVAAIN